MEKYVAAYVMEKKFSQVSALIAPAGRETIGSRNNNGPTGCATTLPDLDEQHLSERNRLP